jgi:hypothetical protein
LSAVLGHGMPCPYTANGLPGCVDTAPLASKSNEIRTNTQQSSIKVKRPRRFKMSIDKLRSIWWN